MWPRACTSGPTANPSGAGPKEGVSIAQDTEKVASSSPFNTDVVDTAECQREVHGYYADTHPCDSCPEDASDGRRKAERVSNEAPPSLAWGGGRMESGTDGCMKGRERAPGS